MDQQQSPYKSPQKLTLPPISRTNYGSPQESPRVSQSVRLDNSLVNPTPDVSQTSPVKGGRPLN